MMELPLPLAGGVRNCQGPAGGRQRDRLRTSNFGGDLTCVCVATWVSPPAVLLSPGLRRIFRGARIWVGSRGCPSAT